MEEDRERFILLKDVKKIARTKWIINTTSGICCILIGLVILTIIVAFYIEGYISI